MSESSVKSILFITLSNIGDAILTTPALEALHQAYPDAVIDIVGDARSDIVFRHCPYRGEIFLKHKKEGWRGILKLVRQLRRKNYDLAVDLRTDGLLWLLRAKRRVFKLSSRAGRHLHSAIKHFRAVAPITGLQQTPPAKLWLSEAERARANVLLAGLEGKRLLVFGLGANWLPKIWPAGYFADLANQLQDHFDAVLLLGSTRDKSLADTVAAKLQLPCLDLSGKTNFLEAAAVLEHGLVFVGNDSGLGHLAGAIGTPAMIVFRHDEGWRYHPWGKRVAWVQAEQHDMESITPQQVRDAMLPLLDDAS